MAVMTVTDETEVDVIEAGNLLYTHYLATVLGTYDAGERMIGRIKDRLARYGRAVVTAQGCNGPKLLTLQLARK